MRSIPRWFLVPAADAGKDDRGTPLPGSCAYQFPRALTPTLAAALGELSLAPIRAAVDRPCSRGYRMVGITPRALLQHDGARRVRTRGLRASRAGAP